MGRGLTPTPVGPVPLQYPEVDEGLVRSSQSSNEGEMEDILNWMKEREDGEEQDEQEAQDIMYVGVYPRSSND